MPMPALRSRASDAAGVLARLLLRLLATLPGGVGVGVPAGVVALTDAAAASLDIAASLPLLPPNTTARWKVRSDGTDP